MDKLVKTLEEMRDILEKMFVPSIKPKTGPTLPSVKNPPVPSMKPKVPNKMPGIKPASQKDPKKMAEQLKSPTQRKAKIEMLKFDNNGQWTLHDK